MLRIPSHPPSSVLPGNPFRHSHGSHPPPTVSPAPVFRYDIHISRNRYSARCTLFTHNTHLSLSLLSLSEPYQFRLYPIPNHKSPEITADNDLFPYLSHCRQSYSSLHQTGGCFPSAALNSLYPIPTILSMLLLFQTLDILRYTRFFAILTYINQ